MIRYPGSKAKISRRIVASAFPPEWFLDLWQSRLTCYCEPFFGSGALGWDILGEIAGKVCRLVLNDLDPGIAALWRSVRDAPRELIHLVAAFRPSTDAFYRFKEQDGDTSLDPVVLGFQKLALHQTSFSGLGYKSGGPLGGRKQRSEYNTDCRWNAARIATHIMARHRLMQQYSHVDILNEDFAPVLDSLPDNAFVYLDPPYYVQGEALYRHAMTDADHKRLANQLRRARFRWVLSYDDHPRIRELYAWARIESFFMTPTVQRATTKQRRKNSEVVISNP